MVFSFKLLEVLNNSYQYISVTDRRKNQIEIIKKENFRSSEKVTNRHRLRLISYQLVSKIVAKLKGAVENSQVSHGKTYVRLRTMAH